MKLTIINYPLETFTPTQSGALATIIYECCRAAAKQGIRPWVMTRAGTPEMFDWPELIPIPYPAAADGRIGSLLWRAERKLTGWRHLRHRAYAIRVAAAIRARGLQDGPVLILNDPETAVFLKRRFRKIKLAHWFENQLECREPFRSAYRDSADVTFGVSNFTSRWVREYYGTKHAITLYNGVNGDHFTPEQYGQADHEHPIVNFVGRTGIEKGPDILLKAALMLARQKQAFQVQIVGSNHWDRLEIDDYQRELSGYASELECLGVTVRRTGHVGRADLPGTLRTARINVVPARWDEPFGMTTVEGMACGLATIASHTGGTPEVVGEAGILFERENVDQLADGLRLLIEDRDERERLRKLGRERALEFPWKRTWDNLQRHIAAL